MTTSRKLEWFFYPTWILLTALCVPLAFFLYFAISRVIICNGPQKLDTLDSEG
jgi:hypothetical protein